MLFHYLSHSIDTTAPVGHCYCNDRLLPKEIFPNMYEEFMDGDFAIKLSQHECSVLSADQALQNDYSKNDKEKRGAISFKK